MTFKASKVEYKHDNEIEDLSLSREEVKETNPTESNKNIYFQDLQQQIQRGIEGKNEGIPIGFSVLGKYATIRKGMYYLVGGYTGCLSGDTLIGINRKQKTANLKFYRLDDLYKKFHGLSTKDKWDLTLDTNTRSYKADLGCTGLNKILDVVYSGKKEVFEIKTSSGKTIKATKDHRFLISNIQDIDQNIYKRLYELSIGDEIYIKSPKTSKKVGRKVSHRTEITSKMPYYTTAKSRRINGFIYQRMYKYRVIYDAYLNKLSVKKFLWEVKNNPNHNLIFSSTKDVIHHKDGNPLNNNISNLILLKKEDHDRLHAKTSNYGHSWIHKEKIISIESKGVEDTYDISCDKPYHNFIANDFVVHNSGKSTLAHEAFILNPLDWYIKNYNKSPYKLNLIFRSMERSKNFMLAKWLSRRIFLDTGVVIPVGKLLGWWHTKLTSDEHDLTKMYEDYFGHMMEIITIIDGPENPIGIAKELSEHFRKRGKEQQIDKYNKVYIPDNEMEITAIIVDHVKLMKGTKDLTSPKMIIDKWSEECRYHRDYYGACCINIQQFNRDISNPIRLKMGDVTPNLEDFADTATTQHDADLVLGLFDPGRYKVESLTRHDLSKLQSEDGSKRYRSLHVLKSTYGADGVVIPYALQPELGIMKELPRSSNMTSKIYNDVLNNNYFRTNYSLV